MIKTTREQVKEFRLIHPYWSKSDIARAVVPPVSPQRIGQIELEYKTDFTSEKYREIQRHRYHLKNGNVEKRKNCRFCRRLPIDKV